jgi:hypothetical protein
MAKDEKRKKSAHLQQLEESFDRHTRRFSPFAVLGLRPDENAADEASSPENAVPTHMGVDATHTHGPPTHMGVDATPVPGMGIHTRVVERSADLTTLTRPTHMGVDTTHTDKNSGLTAALPDDAQRETPKRVSAVDPVIQSSLPNQTDVRMQDVLAATQLRAQLGKKARQVLAYLNSIRSVEMPAYSVPVGYAHIGAAADVHQHYLRRNVLPKLAMLGLIGIAHKSLQGTIYHLHYDAAFLRMVAADDTEMSPAGFPALSTHTQLPVEGPASVTGLPDWLDREHWGWLAPEMVQQLVMKAGTEAQAREKLDIILYNETHGPEERRVRDRRAVLAHYLRTPHADIWPNDEEYETLPLRQARLERDRAFQEKALAEEALRARQEAAKARFLASLAETQLQWLKRQAKERVDSRPDAKFLHSRYPLYKAEEEELIREWLDRAAYGERVPHVMTENLGETDRPDTQRARHGA